jgi:hypothetical protein
MNPCTLAFYPPHLVQDDGDTAPRHADYKILHPDDYALAKSAKKSPNRHHSGSSSSSPSCIAGWVEVDAKFRRALPDSWYLRRMAYRALILETCPSLRMLDGLPVGKNERSKMARLLKGCTTALPPNKAS